MIHVDSDPYLDEELDEDDLDNYDDYPWWLDYEWEPVGDNKNGF